MIANILLKRASVVKRGFGMIGMAVGKPRVGNMMRMGRMFKRNTRMISEVEKLNFDEDDEDFEENYEKLKELRSMTAENILTHDVTEFQKLIKMYSGMGLVDQELHSAFEKWMVERREETPDFTFLVLCEKTLAMGFKPAQPFFYEKTLGELLKESGTISADRVIGCLDIIDSSTNMDQPSPFSRRFMQDLEKMVNPIYSKLSNESQISLLKIALHSKKSIKEIPEKWTNVLTKITSTKHLMDCEPILILMFDLGMDTHIPDELLQRIETLALSENNSLRIQLLILNLLDRKFKSGSGDKNILEDQLLKIINRVITDYQDIYFGSLVYYLDFSFNFVKSRSLNYRKFQGSIEDSLAMLVDYFEEGSEIFNLDEVFQILTLYQKGNNILMVQVPKNYDKLLSCLITGAKLSQEKDMSDRIAYLRILNRFLESNNYIGLLDHERTKELMVELVKTLTSKQVNFEEFMEICTQITQLNKSADDDAIESFDIEHLYLLFSQQSLNLKFKSYEELVKVLTMLEFMAEDVPRVEDTKEQLLQKFSKK